MVIVCHSHWFILIINILWFVSVYVYILHLLCVCVCTCICVWQCTWMHSVFGWWFQNTTWFTCYMRDYPLIQLAYTVSKGLQSWSTLPPLPLRCCQTLVPLQHPRLMHLWPGSHRSAGTILEEKGLCPEEARLKTIKRAMLHRKAVRKSKLIIYSISFSNRGCVSSTASQVFGFPEKICITDRHQFFCHQVLDENNVKKQLWGKHGKTTEGEKNTIQNFKEVNYSLRTIQETRYGNRELNWRSMISIRNDALEP